jgi:hypothetical protein
VGEFFDTPRLGRGFARVDWNLDGRDDFVISHLESHAALLTHAAPLPGQHGVQLQLHGRFSSRDAIGARVSAYCSAESGRPIVRHLTAGDGYLSCNERLLQLGLGATDSIARLKIEWPSGLVQEFIDVPADRRYLTIEGGGLLVQRLAGD